MNTHSPFHIVQDFLSPKVCEQIVDDLQFYEPDFNPAGKPLASTKRNDKAEELIFDKVQSVIEDLEDRYQGFSYKGMEHVKFSWYPEEFEGSDPSCESSKFLRKKWVKVHPRDLTGVIFLSDYQETTPFDSEYECYGGKLEFPQHQFGFQPQRGTLVIFPSDPHFINLITSVYVGDLFTAKFHIASDTNYLYEPRNFPGDYRDWLKEFV